MRATSWSELIDPQAMFKRAGGRRHYNRVRQARAMLRRSACLRLLRRYGLGRGSQAAVARKLGVSRSTVCRDVARFKRMSRRWLEAGLW